MALNVRGAGLGFAISKALIKAHHAEYGGFKISYLLMLLWGSNAYAEEDLFALEFEQLMQVEVISVAKKPQRLSQTAAAIHVISQEDIQHSGMNSLPELLRGVPGVTVARIDANKWAISIRGMTDRFANKLLVLVDGRSVYTPIFSGVYWNMQDMPLDNIEQIEIIRGSGGALWGTNAVNGVINIITKHTKDTQGTRLSVAAGSLGELVTARFGDQVDENTSYRVFAKGTRVTEFNDSDKHQYPAHDEWRNISTGFRLDSQQGKTSTWLLDSGFNIGDAGQTTSETSLAPPSTSVIQDRIDYKKGHILLRLNKQIASQNDVQVQAYFDYFERTATGSTLTVLSYDIDFQQQLQWDDGYGFIWGLGYRGVDDYLQSSFTVSFTPEKNYASTFSGFLQGEVQLSDALRFTLGSKFEHNDFSGFEYQPSANLLWELTPEHSFWLSGSRAVRVPSRSHENMRINYLALPANPNEGSFAAPTLFSILGNPNLKSEAVESVELGYRGLLTPRFSFDVATFYSHYRHLNSQIQSVGFEAEPLPAHVLIANTINNDMLAHSYGVEVAAKWQVTEQWHLSANYSWIAIDAKHKAGSTASIDQLIDLEKTDPQHQASVKSVWKIFDELTFTSAVYYVDKIKVHNVNAYVRLDLGVQWQFNDYVTLSLNGANLLDKQHQEFHAQDAFHTDMPRSVYAKIVTRF